MKLFKTIFLSLFTLFITFHGYAQRAKDGNYTVSTSGDVVNTYTSASAYNAGSLTLTVANNAMSGAHFSGNLQAGDLIMIYQAYGASVDINTEPVVGWGSNYTVPNSYLGGGNFGEFPTDFGRITNYNGAGRFEQVQVASVAGASSIVIQCGLKNSYDFSKKVQIVRVPRFDNLTVNTGSSIVPAAWNGTTGGIVAIEVETALTMNAGGLIHANGFGFRGGQLDGAASFTGSTSNLQRLGWLGTYEQGEGSEKGESIFGYHVELDAVYSRWGVGAVANGGGGGSYQNAGGGGGSNVSPVTTGYTGNGVPDPTYNVSWALDFSGPVFDYTSVPFTPVGTTSINGTSTPGGGRGGYTLAQTDQNELTVGPRNSAWGGDGRKTNGGRGGHPLAYDATRLFFGGGGGSGDQDSGQGGAGGNGGGIVYITCFGTISGTGSIEARGAAGQNTNPNNQNVSSTPTVNRRKGNDGAGGGGAGGAIFIENATAIPATIALNARGGDGGNQNIRLYHVNAFNTTTDEAAGPGGSGAGGSIAFSSGTPTQNVTAGSNGVVTSERGTSAGYTPTPSPMVGNFPANGATNGSVGMGSLSAPYYDLQIADITTCVTPVTLTVTVLGTIPSGGTIGWYTQEFGGSTFATGTSTSVSPAVTTTYYVGVCPGSFRVPVTVTVTATAPTPTISGGPTTFCTGGSVLLTSSAATGNQWSLDGTPIVGATNQTYSATTAGNYTVIATSGGCTSAASLATTVTINPIPATPTISGGPTTFCTGGSVLLTSSSATGNQWSLDGTPIGGATNQTYSATAAGNYTVIATTGGCPSLASSATAVTINPIPATPTIGAGGPLTFCSGGSVLLTSSSATGNQWSLNGTPIGGATNQTYSATASGDYTVITTSGGCPSLASAATTVSVTPTPATPTIGAGGPTAFCSGGSVLLTSSSATGNQWLLDGTPIVGATNQTYSATTAGDYTVIVSTGGCPSLASVATTVTVNPLPATPTIGAGGPLTFCAGGSVTLTSSSVTGNQWSLNGTPIVGATNQTYSATASGDYTVMVTSAGCSSAASAATTVVVTPIPVITAGTVTNPSACGTATGSIQVNGSATGVVSWTGTAVGNSGSVSLPYTITGLAAGTYNIKITVGTCSSNTLVQGLSDPSAPATPTVAASGPITFCVPGSVTLTSSSAAGNQWSLNGTPIGGATNQTLIVSASGDYTVVVTSGGCTSLASAVTTVTANAIPTVTATNDGPICIGGTFNLGEIGGDAVSWAWSSSGGATITANTDQSPIVTGAVDGEVFTVVITDANTCTNSANTAISVIQSPVLDAITDVVNCGPYTLPAITGTNLTGSEAYYDNSIASGGAQITGPITSTQTVWVYDGIATCEDEISFQVTINPLPSVVSFTGGSSYCDGDIASDLMIDVTGSADWSINYTLNGVAQTIVSSTTPISIGNAEGVYVLTGISDVNCSNSASQTQTIIITATPAQPVASSDVVYCTDDLPGSVSVSGAGGTYTWYTDNALTSVYGTGSIVTVLGTTQVYYVTESLNGCESTPDEVSITFENCEVVYPTAFTPDGDGTNDTWEILGLDEKYPDNTVRIYNRWGNLIFEHESSVTNPYNNSQWDGTYKGAPLPVGSFYYIIDVKGSDEKIKGTVSIILN